MRSLQNAPCRLALVLNNRPGENLEQKYFFFLLFFSVIGSARPQSVLVRSRAGGKECCFLSAAVGREAKLPVLRSGPAVPGSGSRSLLAPGGGSAWARGVNRRPIAAVSRPLTLARCTLCPSGREAQLSSVRGMGKLWANPSP